MFWRKKDRSLIDDAVTLKEYTYINLKAVEKKRRQGILSEINARAYNGKFTLSFDTAYSMILPTKDDIKWLESLGYVVKENTVTRDSCGSIVYYHGGNEIPDHLRGLREYTVVTISWGP